MGNGDIESERIPLSSGRDHADTAAKGAAHDSINESTVANSKWRLL